MNRLLKVIFSAILLLLFNVLFSPIVVMATESGMEISVEQIGESHVRISWEEIAGVEGYTLYRAEEDGTLQLVKHVDALETNNYGLKNGVTYSYAVRPYSISEDGSKVYGVLSQTASLQIGVKTPLSVSAVPNGKKSAVVSWDGDPLADCYILYRSTDGTNWTLVKRVTDSVTTTYGLESGATYWFRVKAVRNVAGKERFSDYSIPTECLIGIAPPSDFQIVRAFSNSVELSWNEVPGATGYRLYRAEDDGDYNLVKTVPGTSTKNYNLVGNVAYRYRLAAIVESETYSFKSDYAYTEPIKLSLDAPTQLKINKMLTNGVALSWDPVGGATAYRLYRTEEDGVTKLVKTVSDTETNTFSLESGKRYQFSVKAICSSGTAIVNGSISEAADIFFINQPDFCVNQAEINTVSLSWKTIDGANSYDLKLIGDDIEIIEGLTSTQYTWNVTNASGFSYALRANQNGVYSLWSKIHQYNPVFEDILSFSILDAVGDGKVSIAWEPVNGAVQYELERKTTSDAMFTSIYQGSKTEYLDTQLAVDTCYIYRYRVQYKCEENTFWGNWSDGSEVSTPAAPVYRALLIGEQNYETVLNGPVNDVEAMENVLKGYSEMNWDVYSQTDATVDEIVSLILLAFEDAAENDVSLFYYSGHGVMGSGDYYAGALMTVDYDYIPMQDLAELLSAIPGRVIVILDSCGSGAAISGGVNTFAAEGNDTFTPEEFNNGILQIFSQYNSREQAKSGELAVDKFCVLTASAYEQESRSLLIDKVWGGAFTRAFAGCAGYDYNSKTWSSMAGDSNSDGMISLSECYLYCHEEALPYQDVQVYPQDSSVILLFK